MKELGVSLEACSPLSSPLCLMRMAQSFYANFSKEMKATTTVNFMIYQYVSCDLFQFIFILCEMNSELISSLLFEVRDFVEYDNANNLISFRSHEEAPSSIFSSQTT
jgi:hypothetical protein